MRWTEITIGGLILFDFFFSSEIGIIMLFSIPLILVLMFTIWMDSKKEKEESEKSRRELEEWVKNLEEKLLQKEKEETKWTFRGRKMSSYNMGIGLKVSFVAFFVILSISVLLNVYFYSFQEEINNLKKPKLVAVVQGSDERPLLQSSFLHLTGYVFNVGKDIARDCSLHVILYQGNVVAVDTYIRLGNING